MTKVIKIESCDECFFRLKGAMWEADGASHDCCLHPDSDAPEGSANIILLQRGEKFPIFCPLEDSK
jgi:hypothetical protein